MGVVSILSIALLVFLVCAGLRSRLVNLGLIMLRVSERHLKLVIEGILIYLKFTAVVDAPFYGFILHRFLIHERINPIFPIFIGIVVLVGL